jgi:hypothetical protein
MIINYNTFQILLEGELLIGLPSMKLLIQWQHGMKYSGLSSIDLMKQVATTLRYAKQKKYESIKHY